jgi:hypothetical protein
MEQNFMRIYYFCDIFQKDYVLYARKNSSKDKDFLRGYIERLGDRFQLIQLEEGETWQTVSERWRPRLYGRGSFSIRQPTQNNGNGQREPLRN